MTSKYAQKRSEADRQSTSHAKDNPVANRAQKGPPNRKMAKRLAIRIYAWMNPEYSKSCFALAKDEGGAKRPGSMKK